MRVSLPEEGSLLPESDCVKMKRCEDKRVVPLPQTLRLLRRPGLRGPLRGQRFQRSMFLPLCPHVELSWVPAPLRCRELSEGSFPLASDRERASVPCGAPDRATLPDGLPELVPERPGQPADPAPGPHPAGVGREALSSPHCTPPVSE